MSPLTEPGTAIIHEIFSGIQGEGTLVGYRQIFVRFHGCNLCCGFCDTPASRDEAPASCAVEQEAGTRVMAARANPLGVADVLAALRLLQEGYPHHSVSLTGGEPLMQAPFLAVLLPALHAAGYRSFLETNGVLAAELAALPVPPHYVAMDMKLPATAGIAPQWARHAAFLAAVVARVGAGQVTHRLQVKLVFGEESLTDIAQAAALIAACRPDIPCILQPVTPHPAGPPAPSAATVLEAQRLAARVLHAVRVIPQTHVMLGQW